MAATAMARGKKATNVGASRSYLGVHYPGDVLAGWVLAILSVGIATVLLP